MSKPSWGESDTSVRSAALSARARQLTPQAGEREKLRLRPKGVTPSRRRLRSTVPPAVAVVVLSLCAGVAFAGGGGGVRPPNSPKVSDVVCVSTCGGIHKATVNSKVDLSGRHLEHVTRVLFNATGGGRIEAPPVRAASRAVRRCR